MMQTRMDHFLKTVLPELKVAVLGDVMLDRYVFGEVNRISPEAPVPVNRVLRTKDTLGGAANVASNLAHLSCQVELGGVVGKDSHWELLQELLQENKVGSTGLLVQESRQTTTKMRVLDSRQQMLRLDFEAVKALEDKEEERLLAWLTAQIEQGLQGLVISDYGKGVFTPSFTRRVISLATSAKLVTVVDPKGSDWEKYRGATFVTPNVKELGECVGTPVPNEDAAIVEVARSVMHTYGIQYLVVTRSEKGITLVGKDGVWHSAATQQDVYDVSGAGDTVVAMILTTAIANLSKRSALFAANVAAGIVVSKVGTYPIHREELLSAWADLQEPSHDGKLFTSAQTLADKIRSWQDKGETVVFTNGCFDLLHRGHVSYLQQAASLGHHLVLGINSDASVARLKGETRPLVHDEDRAFVLAGLGCVDAVIVFEEDTPYELLSVLRPNILVKGGDYKKDAVVGKELVDEVVIVPFEDGFSTTGIVQKISALVKENKL